MVKNGQKRAFLGPSPQKVPFGKTRFFPLSRLLLFSILDHFKLKGGIPSAKPSNFCNFPYFLPPKNDQKSLVIAAE
jgi:hypothetical protein